MDRIIKSCGSKFTTIFSIRCFFEIKEGKVEISPVNLKVVKGYATGRECYQLVPIKDYAYIEMDGSDNEKTGPTPEEIEKAGPLASLIINTDNLHFKKIFTDSALNENGVIYQIFYHMVDKIKNDLRFCYEPPYEEFFVPKIRIINLPHFFEVIERMKYPYIRPTWFEGGEIKTGIITPTIQGNLIGSSKIKVPCWAWMGLKRVKEDMKTDKVIEIKGNEDNTHKIEFEDEVDFLPYDRAVLVFASKKISFKITHPQHEPVEGWFKGLIQFVHLRSRYE